MYGNIVSLIYFTAQECNSPPELLNGYVANNGVIVSSIAEYTCKVGYKITGNDSLKCIQRGDDTLWDGEIPSCIQETEGMIKTSFKCAFFKVASSSNVSATTWTNH
jgi:hypothetical protein